MYRRLIFIVAFTFFCEMSVGQEVEIPTKSYMDQVTERQKIDYVIKLMSDEKIRRGTTLAEIKQIFGKDLEKIDAKTPDGERQYGVSFREKPTGKTQSSKESGSAKARQKKDISWYVTFHVDAGDRVSFYYLTNYTSK